MTLLTEKEAAEKWCPLGRIYRAGGSQLHPFSGGSHWPEKQTPSDDQRCVGSKCMAFRFVNVEWEPGEQILQPGGGSYTTERPPEPRGYCGAFGKVEG